MSDSEQACRQEIIDLHRFFEDWFTGRIPDRKQSFERMSAVMAPGFAIIGPGGKLIEREALLLRVRDAHGTWGGEHRIEIRAMDIRRQEGPLLLVNYQEWHHVGGEARGRNCSAWMRTREGLPNGVEWLHVHETWLPPGS